MSSSQLDVLNLAKGNESNLLAHSVNKQSPHEVTASQIGAAPLSALSDMQVAYISLEQIGLDINTASSYQIVHDAMPENSTLTITWTGNSEQTPGRFGAFGQLMPENYGTCVIRKATVSHWTFYEYSTGIVFNGTFTSVNNEAWTGWRRCAIQFPEQRLITGYSNSITGTDSGNFLWVWHSYSNQVWYMGRN